MFNEIETIAGSPLRVRGNPPEEGLSGLVLGLIPAYAGNMKDTIPPGSSQKNTPRRMTLTHSPTTGILGGDSRVGCRKRREASPAAKQDETPREASQLASRSNLELHPRLNWLLTGQAPGARTHKPASGAFPFRDVPSASPPFAVEPHSDAAPPLAVEARESTAGRPDYSGQISIPRRQVAA